MPWFSKPKGLISPCLSKTANVSPCLSTRAWLSAREELMRMPKSSLCWLLGSIAVPRPRPLLVLDQRAVDPEVVPRHAGRREPLLEAPAHRSAAQRREPLDSLHRAVEVVHDEAVHAVHDH